MLEVGEGVLSEGRYAMTARQKQTLDFLLSYSRERGLMPTIDEIGKHLGVNRVTAWQHLRDLGRAGHIRHARYRSRSIVLTASPCPVCGRTDQPAPEIKP